MCALPSLKGLIQTPLQNIDRHTLNYVLYVPFILTKHIVLNTSGYIHMEDCLRPLPISSEVVHMPGMIFKVFSVRCFWHFFWRKPEDPVGAVLEVGHPLGHHARAHCVLNPAVSVHKFLRDKLITFPVHRF